MQDLKFPTPTAVEEQNLNHLTAGDVPTSFSLFKLWKYLSTHTSFHTILSYLPCSLQSSTMNILSKLLQQKQILSDHTKQKS